MATFPLFAHVPIVSASSHVRPSRDGFRPVVTIFRDGKIVRSIYGDLNRSPIGAAVTAEVAAQHASHDAAVARRHILMSRALAVVAPLVVAALGFGATFAATGGSGASPAAMFRCETIGPDLCNRFPGRPWIVESGDEEAGDYTLAGYETEREARAELNRR